MDRTSQESIHNCIGSGKSFSRPPQAGGPGVMAATLSLNTGRETDWGPLVRPGDGGDGDSFLFKSLHHY